MSLLRKVAVADCFGPRSPFPASHRIHSFAMLKPAYRKLMSSSGGGKRRSFFKQVTMGSSPGWHCVHCGISISVLAQCTSLSYLGPICLPAPRVVRRLSLMSNGTQNLQDAMPNSMLSKVVVPRGVREALGLITSGDLLNTGEVPVLAVNANKEVLVEFHRWR